MHTFISASRLHHTLAESKISRLGLHRSQHHMLMCIKNNGTVCQKELAQKLEISPAAVAVTLKKLEMSGLIKRCTSESDNRVNHIELTEESEKLVEKTDEYFFLIDHTTFSDFTEEEMETFEKLLMKMKNTLKKALREED